MRIDASLMSRFFRQMIVTEAASNQAMSNSEHKRTIRNSDSQQRHWYPPSGRAARLTSHQSGYHHFNQGVHRKRRRKICCVNCGQEGHLYRECKGPVTSFGIIALRKRSSRTDIGPVLQSPTYLCGKHQLSAPDSIPEPESQSDVLYLMVQRKDTMGYIDFIRGKYSDSEKDRMLKTYLEEMTCEERHRLRTLDFDSIWSMLWLNHSSKCYINEYEHAKRKFESLDISALLDSTSCMWTQQEYGFPKGRKTMGESNYHCSIREFCEETGYNKHELRILTQHPIEEVFVGTNGKSYRHVYHIAEIPEKAGPPRLDMGNIQQVGEIRNISWFTYEQCQSIIRPYDTAKLDILRRVHQTYGKQLLTRNK